MRNRAKHRASSPTNKGYVEHRNHYCRYLPVWGNQGYVEARQQFATVHRSIIRSSVLLQFKFIFRLPEDQLIIDASKIVAAASRAAQALSFFAIAPKFFEFQLTYAIRDWPLEVG